MHYYEIVQLGPEITLLGRFLLTREKGEQAYPLLRTRLLMVPGRQALVLVFPKAQVVDASFADETLIRLAEELATGNLGERGLLLAGLTDDSQHNIQAVIRLRHLKIAFLFIQPDASVTILGPLEQGLRDAFECVTQHPRLTAPMLAESLHIAVNSASNRLKHLYDQHLIRRDAQISNKGLEYVYSLWQ